MSDEMDRLITLATARHDQLTSEYYADPDAFPGGKETFDFLHATIWDELDQDLIAGGHVRVPGPTLEERLSALEAAGGISPP